MPHTFFGAKDKTSVILKKRWPNKKPVFHSLGEASLYPGYIYMEIEYIDIHGTFFFLLGTQVALPCPVVKPDSLVCSNDSRDRVAQEQR